MMNEEVTDNGCKKCGECDGMSHHWLPDLVEDVNAGDYACKHCTVRGSQCPDCDGGGCLHCWEEGVVLH